MMEQCSICDELEMSSRGRLADLLNGERVLNAFFAIGEQHAVVPSIGPICVGHSLLVSKAHKPSIFLGSISSHTSDMFALLDQFSEASAHNGRDSIFCFEHGMATLSCEKNLCSTTHAHLHLVPLRQQMAKDVFSSIDSPKLETRTPDFSRLVAGYNEYFLSFIYRRSKSSLFVKILSGEKLPSQYGRKLVAEALGEHRWDWKRDAKTAEIVSTITDYNFYTNAKAL